MGSPHAREVLILIPDVGDNGIGELNFRFARHFRSLVELMSDVRHFVFLSNPKNIELIESWFSTLGHPAAFEIIPTLDPIGSPWARDYFIASPSKIRNEIVYTDLLANVISNDDFEKIRSRFSKDRFVYSPIKIHGGNVISGNQLTLIGADTRQRSISRFGIKKGLAFLDELFGDKILFLGGCASSNLSLHKEGIASGFGFQPLYHIDLYVTKTGTLGRNSREIVFLGRPSKTKELIGRWSEDVEEVGELLDRFFDETEDQLSQFFDVRHFPLLGTRGNLSNSALESRFYFLSFNNVLLDSKASEPWVIAPNFSADAFLNSTDPMIRSELEAFCLDQWRSIGFDVRTMDCLEDIAYGGAGVRCLLGEVN